MKPRRNLYGIHNDFSGVGGGLRRGCILIRNRDGWVGGWVGGGGSSSSSSTSSSSSSSSSFWTTSTQ